MAISNGNRINFVHDSHHYINLFNEFSCSIIHSEFSKSYFFTFK